MLLFRPLRDRNMTLLWLGASIAGLGLQIYDATITWFMVEALGTHATVVVTVTAFISLTFALFGGLLVDRLDEFTGLAWIDLLRGLLVLAPVGWLIIAPDDIWVLVPAVLLMAVLRPLPLPLAYGALPRLSMESGLLHAMNALVDGSQRLARILGPMLIGILQVMLQQTWILGLAALCFLISSVCAVTVRRRLHGAMTAARIEMPVPPFARARPIEDVLEAFRSARSRSEVFYAIVTNMISNGGWQLGLILGTALLLHGEKMADIGGYASVLAAYGCGNVLSSLISGNLTIRNRPRWTLAGHCTAGAGYMLMSVAPNLETLMLAAAITASGPPMADLSFLSMIQNDLRGTKMVARLYRLKLVGSWIGGLGSVMAGSLLFQLFGIRPVIFVCGFALAASAVIGYRWLLRRAPA